MLAILANFGDVMAGRVGDDEMMQVRFGSESAILADLIDVILG